MQTMRMNEIKINLTKIKGGCQSGRKVVTHNSKSDLPLVHSYVSTGILLSCRPPSAHVMQLTIHFDMSR